MCPDAACSEKCPDDSSSGILFELESERSCEVDGIMEEAKVTGESPGVMGNGQLFRQPATP